MLVIKASRITLFTIRCRDGRASHFVSLNWPVSWLDLFLYNIVESRDGSQIEKEGWVESTKSSTKKLPRKHPKGTCQKEGRVHNDPGRETRCLVRKPWTRVLSLTIYLPYTVDLGHNSLVVRECRNMVHLYNIELRVNVGYRVDHNYFTRSADVVANETKI